MKRTIRRRLWLLMFVVVPIGIATGCWFHVDAKTRRELAIARSAFAAHGFPTSFEAIAPKTVPEAENAAPLLQEARRMIDAAATASGENIFHQIEEIELSPGSGFLSASHYAPEALARLVELMGDPRVVAVADLLHAAAARETCVFERDYSQGPALLPEVSGFLTAVRLLTRRALARAATRDLDGAWTDLRAAQTIADWADDPPLLITTLTGNASRGIIRSAMQSVLESSGLPDNASPLLAQLKASLAAANQSQEPALHSERLLLTDWFYHRFLAVGSNWLHEVETSFGASLVPDWLDPWFTPVLSRLGRPALARDLCEVYEFHLEIALMLRRGEAVAWHEWRNLTDRIEASDGVITRVILPTLTTIISNHRVHLTTQRMMIMLLETLQFQQNHRRWPQTPDELGLPVELATDMCSQLPFRVRVNDREVTVVAAGWDGDDDDGREAERPMSSDSDGDIVLRVRWPAVRTPE